MLVQQFRRHGREVRTKSFTAPKERPQALVVLCPAQFGVTIGDAQLVVVTRIEGEEDAAPLFFVVVGMIGVNEERQ